MKKLFVFALCAASAGAMNAQKAVVDQAKKLAGKPEKIEELRALIAEAIKDPSTGNDVNTYYVAGKAEFDAFDKARLTQSIKPDDPSIDPLKMSENLIYGYNYFMAGLPKDSMPDAKGKIKPKHSKDMLNRIFSHQNDYYQAGANLYNAQQLSQAYDAFSMFGDMTLLPGYKPTPEVNDSLIATSYYNAGLSAYFGNELEKSAKAFAKARATNAATKEAYIYEIACWQNIANKDTAAMPVATAAIEAVALDGFKHFGTQEMLFLNNLVNSYILNGQDKKALDLVNAEIANDSDNPSLYGLLGFIYDRLDNGEASLASYIKAAEFPNADYETLKNASKRLARTGTEKWSKIEHATPEQRNEIKNTYFQAALDMAKRAQSLKTDGGNDPDLDYLLENIQYALDTYFGGAN